MVFGDSPIKSKVWKLNSYILILISILSCHPQLDWGSRVYIIVYCFLIKSEIVEKVLILKTLDSQSSREWQFIITSYWVSPRGAEISCLYFTRTLNIHCSGEIFKRSIRLYSALLHFAQGDNKKTCNLIQVYTSKLRRWYPFASMELGSTSILSTGPR